MTDILRGWRPDPFGIHELRYFAADGSATKLVRDGDTWTHDPPPQSVAGEVGVQPTTPASQTSQAVDLTTAQETEVVDQEAATTSSSSHEWEPEAFPWHEQSNDTPGEPTERGADAGIESDDEPPGPVVAEAIPPSMPPATSLDGWSEQSSAPQPDSTKEVVAMARFCAGCGSAFSTSDTFCSMCQRPRRMA
jgi:hypothetical protein